MSSRQAIIRSYYYRGGQGYSAELQAWVSAVEAGGNTAPSATVLRALDTFLATSLETGTILSRMKTGYIFHAGSKGAAKVNLKNPALYPLTESGTVTFSEGNGCKSDGTASYFNQPFTTTEYSGIENDITYIQYISESSTAFSASKMSHGHRSASAVFSVLAPLTTQFLGQAYLYSGAVNFSNTNHKGLYIDTWRSGSNIMFKDGVKTSNTITATTPLVSTNRFILAYNSATTNGGVTPAGYYDKYVAIDLIFDSQFSDTDAANFRTAFNTYKTAVSLP